MAVVLALALTFELPNLTARGFVLDEVWTMEVATGRGSAHQRIPVDQVVAVPQFSRLAGGPPWWRVWANVQITHPPLYLVLLRAWMAAFGDGDASGRLFSVAFSAVSIALLFDVVRLQTGLRGAVWAGALMALSAPQVEHARICRGYTLLTAAALAIADVVVRIRLGGMNRRRWSCLMAAVLATLLTHYFSLGTVVALFVYAVLSRPAPQAKLTAAWATAAAIFAVVWGPFMWRQRHLFATDDPNTLFLTAPDPHHVWTTLGRVALVPMTMLWPPPSLPVAAVGLVFGVALFLVPLVPAVRRRSPWVSLWWLWIWGTLAVVAALDVFRSTHHLYFARYTLLAGPGVYALPPCLAAAFDWPRWSTRLGITATVAACVIGLPQAYRPTFDDPRVVVAQMVVTPGPNDLALFAAPPAALVLAQSTCLQIGRYLPTPGPPVAVLTRPAGPDVAAAARRGRFVFLFTPSADYRAYLPPGRLVGVVHYNGPGNLWTLRYDGE